MLRFPSMSNIAVSRYARVRDRSMAEVAIRQMSLQKFDIFPKLETEYRVGTTIGGILSLLSIVATIVLSWVEIHSFLHQPVRQRLLVDSVKPTELDGVTISSKSQPRLDITVDVTFPRAECYLLHFDALDSVTQLPLPLDQVSSSFMRLSASGAPIEVLLPGFLDSEPSDECGSCDVSKESTGECCRSCQDVFRIYKVRGFRPPPLDQVAQCKVVLERLSRFAHEGCRVSSQFRSIRAAGEFHISPGLSWFNEGWHVHDLGVFGKQFDQLNLTHTIHRLQFTAGDGRMPLDGTTYVQDTAKRWRVVYTADVLGDNFSVSRYGMYPTGQQSPGIVFNYDVSPIMATEYLDREPMLHLVTRLLTVIGGVLGLFRLIDAVSYQSRRKAKPGKELQ